MLTDIKFGPWSGLASQVLNPSMLYVCVCVCVCARFSLVAKFPCNKLILVQYKEDATEKPKILGS